MNAHADDLALAQQCAAGDEPAWERFMREYRPVLYRAADALDPTGGARDLADGLYADLYGMQERGGQRRSLLHYFQGRSSLATWLRAVLAQRYVDRVRAQRRLVPLAEEEPAPDDSPRQHAHATTRHGGLARPSTAVEVSAPDPDTAARHALLHQTLSRAVDRLTARDRLRLGCYYAQGLTLAQTGRSMKEHEATVSRQLARTRRAIREDVERQLRHDAGLTDAQIAECFGAAAEDPGSLDLDRMFSAASGSKEPAPDRSVS